jgi:hypothetical protein
MSEATRDHELVATLIERFPLLAALGATATAADLARALSSSAPQPSYTVREWCRLRRVSRSKFYELDADGRAPRTHYAGVKRLISPEADQDWIREQEAAAAATAAANAAPTTWAERLPHNPEGDAAG